MRLQNVPRYGLYLWLIASVHLALFEAGIQLRAGCSQQCRKFTCRSFSSGGPPCVAYSPYEVFTDMPATTSDGQFMQASVPFSIAKCDDCSDACPAGTATPHEFSSCSMCSTYSPYGNSDKCVTSSSQ